MNTETLASAIVGHLVGDYLIQNDWMALNKKSSSLVCALHAAIWTVCVCLFACWPLQGTWWVGTLVFLPHFIQDRFSLIVLWMRLIGQKRFMKCDEFDLTDMRVVPGLGPWSVIVVDNVWHIVAIWLVWRFVA